MKIFSNVAALKLASLTVGEWVETSGYYTANDGGGARYLVSASGTSYDGYGSHLLANSTVAVIEVAAPINIRTYGGMPSAPAATQEAAFNAAEAASPNESIYVPYDTYDLNSGTFTGKYHSYGTPVFTTGIITVLNLNP